ncbi:uncharacterized protein N7498_005973 [Penicillium cinerascens]|uniref:Secreted protein n=1 Tax=Penicillium cinerascens TaxID=70096 RepID=A0A9W9MPG2_9EURO|nr:uncharacterized protein N7498_005973 [Penicillium cinerascens]KAJ5205094.1 hypothetical protein N7498_005973 [Penicillium cinerascens]
MDVVFSLQALFVLLARAVLTESSAMKAVMVVVGLLSFVHIEMVTVLSGEHPRIMAVGIDKLSSCVVNHDWTPVRWRIYRCSRSSE